MFAINLYLCLTPFLYNYNDLLLSLLTRGYR